MSSSLHSKSSSKPSSVLPLCRRLLFPHLPPSSPLPPILPNASHELNTELYVLIALSLRAYVVPWWSKMTRYDTEFVPHVASIISALIRALVARLQKADIETFAFRAVPMAIAQHYTDYRAASAKLGSAYANGGAATLSQLFHQHQNHMAIDTDGNIDATYIRHLVDLILHECLPVEDKESDVERSIIREVVVKLVTQDIAPLLSQPWFIYKLMLDQLTSGQNVVAAAAKATEVPESNIAVPPSHGFVIFVLSTVQYLSGLCLVLIHWYKGTKNLIRRVNGAPKVVKPGQQWDFASCLLKCVSEILHVENRMTSRALFTTVESLVRLFEEFVDRFLVYLLQYYVLTEQRVITVVRLSKQTLYPNGYPGPPTIIPPPEEEQLAIKEQLIREIETRVPSTLAKLVLGPGSKGRDSGGVAEALEPLSSEACNTHLLLLLLDLIVLTLFPEFGVEDSAEEERGDKGEMMSTQTSRSGRSSRSRLISSGTGTPSPSPEPSDGRSQERSDER